MADYRRKILLADDSKTFQALFRTFLARSECELLVCNDGQEALDLIGGQYIDFVCSSFYLRDMEGIVLCQRIRQLTKYASKPFVLLTSVDNADALNKALPAGVTDIFQKSDVEQLLAFIKRFPSSHMRIEGRILYVEDSNSQRMLLQSMLERRGLSVEAFASADEAYRHFEQSDYDLVLTDIVLEGHMSGLALVNRIRRQTSDKGDIPILAITAFNDKTRRIELFNLGVTDYILKPVAEEELFARIGSLLEMRRITRDLELEQQQRHAEELSLNKARLQAVFDVSPDPVLISDEQGTIVSANRQVENMFGYAISEILGQSIEVLIPQRFRDHHPIHRKEFATQPSSRRMGHGLAIKALRKDGSELDVEVSLSRINTSQGSLFASALRNITERKQSEAKLRIAAVAFESQEAMLVTDANALILQVNRAFTEITGYAQEEVVGQNPSMLKSGRHDQEFYRQMWETINRDGGWQGEIWDRRKNGEEYLKWLIISAVRNDDGTVTHYIGAHYDITERKKYEEKIQWLALFDQLTALPNRFSLHQRIEQALSLAGRNQKQLALMLIDLDNFKTVNDTLGHQIGDKLLVQVAQRLVGSVRQSDLVARLGGDEFVVVLPDIDSSTDVAHAADKIVMTVSAPYRIDGQELRTSPSIGICLYPDDAADSENLLKKADVAMYHAKASGRGNYQFFKEEIQAAAVERLTIEADLRLALEKQQLVLHYQPQLDLRSGRLVGVEALIRWDHPERGMVSPLDFIPIAEESGLILPIGDWVLAEACRQLAEWRADGMEHIRMSVNLAASQFADENLPARIQAMLAKADLPASSLDLEVTESMTMKSPADAAAMMKVLTGQNLSLSIDDFGTGYSSLAYLKLFPISTLKIDRSFVKDIETDQNDADICDVTVLLAHKLGLNVVAEGVETEAQLKYLLSIGCEKIQGYLISKPLPANKARDFIGGYQPPAGLGTIDLWGSPMLSG